jgi:tetratricopeptide (TPR) repeat protein
VMDDKKMETFYELGDLYERQGNFPEALKYFKDIYARDIGYKDVAQKVQNLHSKA